MLFVHHGACVRRAWHGSATSLLGPLEVPNPCTDRSLAVKVTFSATPTPRVAAVLVVLVGISLLALTGGSMTDAAIMMIGVAYGHLLATDRGL